MNNEILKSTNQYYTKKIEEFGKTSRGVDWNSTESQRLRFEQISKVFSAEGKNSFSICDYGCGYGYLSEYLEEQGYCCDYYGMDISEKMIAAAKETYAVKKNRCFINSAELIEKYDYIVASGIFNVRQKTDDKEWGAYMSDVITQFNEHSQKGFSFNCLTKYSDADYMKDYLYYADPLYYFDYCKKHFSRNVALLHDYDLYEFTIIVRK